MIAKSEIREVNMIARLADDSQLWPVRGRFNVTERAIRQARKVRAECGECYDRQQYEELLADLVAAIVNDYAF